MVTCLIKYWFNVTWLRQLLTRGDLAKSNYWLYVTCLSQLLSQCDLFKSTTDSMWLGKVKATDSWWLEQTAEFSWQMFVDFKAWLVGLTWFEQTSKLQHNAADTVTPLWNPFLSNLSLKWYPSNLDHELRPIRVLKENPNCAQVVWKYKFVRVSPRGAPSWCLARTYTLHFGWDEFLLILEAL